jgi:hypothetical protein
MIKLSGTCNEKTTSSETFYHRGKGHVIVSHKYTEHPFYPSSLSNQAEKNWECLACSSWSTLIVVCPSSSFYVFTGKILCFTDFFSRMARCYPKVHHDRAPLLPAPPVLRLSALLPFVPWAPGTPIQCFTAEFIKAALNSMLTWLPPFPHPIALYWSLF